MRRIAIVLTACCFCFLTSCTRHAINSGPPPPQFTLRDLGTLGGEWGYAAGLNNKGQVVGRLGDKENATQAFLWSNGKFTLLGPKAGRMTIASQLNDQGQIVGTIDPLNIPNSTGAYAFLWKHGHLSRIIGSGVQAQSAEGINNQSDIVGEAHFGGRPIDTFLWRKGKIYDLGGGGNARAINNKGQMVGRSGNNAVAWLNGSTSFQTIAKGDARAINNRGQIIGDDFGHAFFWENGSLSDLGTLGKVGNSAAFGLNDAGQVVGNSSDETAFKVNGVAKYARAFLWQHGQMYDLNGLVKRSDVMLTVGNAINNRGQILCSAIINGKAHSVLLTPTR